MGPERVRGCPRSHSPGELRLLTPGFPPSARQHGRGCRGSPRSPLTWLIPRPRGASPRQGPEPGRAPAERPRPSHSHSDPVPLPQPLCPVSAPPPWNSDPAWRGRVGPRALKGAVQFPSWQGGLEEELESPDWGPGLALPSGRHQSPRRSYHLSCPILTQASAHSPFHLPWSPLGRVWVLLIASLPPSMVSLEEATGPIPEMNSGSDRGWGLRSHLRLVWTSLGQINEATRSRVSSFLVTVPASLTEWEDGPVVPIQRPVPR